MNKTMRFTRRGPSPRPANDNEMGHGNDNGPGPSGPASMARSAAA